MPWFGVKVLRRLIVSDSPPSDDVYEESVFLVIADDDEGAAERARELCLQHSYRNVYGELATWRLDRVFEPFQIWDFELADGLEVYSRLYYLRDGQEYWPEE
jgi:hypothetical protein